MRLEFRDWASDPDGWARELGASREAIDVYRASDVLDLHLDTFIWNRVFGYDLRKRHSGGVFGRHFYGQVDFPRVLEAGMTGGTWVVTTNPFRPRGGRPETFMGLAGAGDLILTCTGDLSRNRRVGLALAKGTPLKSVLAALGHIAEGVYTARAVARLAKERNVDMPITQAVCRVLDEPGSARAAVHDLMAREQKPEY